MADGTPPRLTQISGMLRPAPRSLEDLASALGDAEGYTWFRKTVHALFPQEADGLLALPSNTGRVIRFEALFEQKFFPFHGGYDDMDPAWDFPDGRGTWPVYGALRDGAYLHLMGVSLEDFRHLWESMTPGLAAMALLAWYPEHVIETFYEGEDNIRETWLEAAGQHLPRKVLEKIPAKGIPTYELARAVQDTPYAGLASAVRWLGSCSGNPIIDCSEEEYDPSGLSIEWEDRESLEEIAHTWKEAQGVAESAMELATRLEQDLPREFGKMLAFINERLERLPPPEGAGANEEEDD